jgi:hypothetical protein
MTRKVVSTKDGQELKRLYEQHALGAMQASIVLSREGTESPKFNEADKAAGKAWRRIRIILGDSNSYLDVKPSSRQTLANCPKARSARMYDRCNAVYEGLVDRMV